MPSDAEIARDLESLLDDSDPHGDPGAALVLADALLERDDLRGAAAALDRAFGLRPDDDGIARQRAEVLRQLTVVEHGLVFRYVPAGTFLQGSDRGDPDERPIHAVRLDDYWMTDVPITWSAYCDVLGWSPPPAGFPDDDEDVRTERFELFEANKIRLQYCETETEQAGDWHAHRPNDVWSSGETSEEIFGTVPRDAHNRPWTYDVKPMIAVSWQEANEFCEKLSTDALEYRLPTEREWERAARGGRIGASYPWGDDPPTDARCDFGHFGDWVIRPPRSFPPNGYGLHGMVGGVSEWTSTPYDAMAYSSDEPPGGVNEGTPRVLRGGSWADCAAAVTVSFRAARVGAAWGDEAWGNHLSPTIGFRVCRVEPEAGDPTNA